MNDKEKIDYIKQLYENPVLAIEVLIGRKLTLWEKTIVKIQLKIKNRNDMWKMGYAWRKFK